MNAQESSYYVVEFDKTGNGIKWTELETTRTDNFDKAREMANDLGTCFDCPTRVVWVTRQICTEAKVG